jgi:hypothetical protein
VGYLSAQLKRTAMRLPDVVQAGHPVLRQKAVEVPLYELQKEETQKLIKTMVCDRALVHTRSLFCRFFCTVAIATAETSNANMERMWAGRAPDRGRQADIRHGSMEMLLATATYAR